MRVCVCRVLGWGCNRQLLEHTHILNKTLAFMTELEMDIQDDTVADAGPKIVLVLVSENIVR